MALFCLLAFLTLAAVGLALMLPPGRRRKRQVGMVLSAASLGLLAFLAPPMGEAVHQVVFWLLAAVTAAGAVATISSRNPVYSAIWFALTLLTTAGLFLVQGAQFLGVATVVVYAGAILVTFLFVLMLAQPAGHDFYDRIGWGAAATWFASLAGVLIVGGLTYLLTVAEDPREQQNGNADIELADDSPAGRDSTRRDADPAEGHHMASIGATLFTRHLISVEVGGTLLLVALVGAIAIVIQGKQPMAHLRDSRQGDPIDGA